MPGDGLIQRVVLHQVQNRSEDLFLDHGHGGRSAHNRRLDEEAGTVETVASGKHFAALQAGLFETIQHVEHRAIFHQRPHHRSFVQRVADADLLVSGDETLGELSGDLALYEEPADRSAALAGRAHRAKDRGAQSKIEVGIFGDDDAVIAAEFQQRAA